MTPAVSEAMVEGRKPTKAQLAFLRGHDANGYRSRWKGYGGTYDFVGRMRKAGFIEIIDGAHLSWPYGWDGTRLTDAGRKAIGATP